MTERAQLQSSYGRKRTISSPLKEKKKRAAVTARSSAAPSSVTVAPPPWETPPARRVKTSRPPGRRNFGRKTADWSPTLKGGRVGGVKKTKKFSIFIVHFNESPVLQVCSVHPPLNVSVSLGRVCVSPPVPQARVPVLHFAPTALPASGCRSFQSGSLLPAWQQLLSCVCVRVGPGERA